MSRHPRDPNDHFGSVTQAGVSVPWSHRVRSGDPGEADLTRSERVRRASWQTAEDTAPGRLERFGSERDASHIDSSRVRQRRHRRDRNDRRALAYARHHRGGVHDNSVGDLGCYRCRPHATSEARTSERPSNCRRSARRLGDPRVHGRPEYRLGDRTASPQRRVRPRPRWPDVRRSPPRACAASSGRQALRLPGADRETLARLETFYGRFYSSELISGHPA